MMSESQKEAPQGPPKHKAWCYEDEVSADVLDSIRFGENVKIDWNKYPMFHRKCWDAQKTDQELK